MCLALPARVIALNDQGVEVELREGTRVLAAIDLYPNVALGQYVLVDRGQVVQVIDAAEAEAIYAIYDEMGRLLEDADALEQAGPTPVLEFAGDTRRSNAG